LVSKWIERCAEPLYNGIAIASDGTVIVALRDGRIVGIR
jgi:hypothetical protein